MTIDDLKKEGLIIYECISGSKAYNLDLPTSDTDIKGVFVLPKKMFYGLNYIPQISNPTNDIVYYELGRFIDLLKKNNPNILELLATPKDKILIKHEVMDLIKPEYFLSKKCKDTFGGYAFTQVKKARGLNKKIVNPIAKEKKTILDFCYVLEKQGAVALKKWLEIHSKNQAHIGLVDIPHFANTYGLYYDETNSLGYHGVMKKSNASTVLLSSVPKDEKCVSQLYFNHDGYVKYCIDYKQYWDWVAKRNQERYQNNVAHGKNYDSKNMMHTFRLLDMAEEILRTGEIIVKRPNRTELLSIRKGEWRYDDLVEKAEMKMKQLEVALENCPLQDAPDEQLIEDLLVKLRMKFYQ